ncbi:MAG: response regulator transcription factor [Pirellula sp.]|jgi:two-component system response regulator FixJ
MSSEKPKVYIVDDDASFLKAVSRLLRASGFDVLVFDSVSDFLSEVNQELRGCIITDLRMPNIDGFAFQTALKSANIALPVIFLTAFGDIPSSVLAMRLGAEDFLCKSASKHELIGAIERAIKRDAKQHEERARLHELQAPFKLLTPRELEVLTHVLKGEPNKAIAAILGIDERSVKRHRTNLMTKLQVGSVAELTHLAHASGFYETKPANLGHSNGFHNTPTVPKGTLGCSKRLK